MLILNENEIKEIISNIVRKQLKELKAKDVTKKMGYKSPKQDPFKKKKLTHVNMHAPGLMGEGYYDENGLYWVPCPFAPGKEMLGTPPNENFQNIQEWRGDRRIPFEEPEYANKANYEHFIDWLENIGRYGQLSGSGDAEELYQNSLEGGFELFKKENPSYDSDVEDFFYAHPPKQYPHYYENGEEQECFNVDFTERGEIELNKFFEDKFFERVDVKFNVNDRNLIYIYRSISIPSLTRTDYKNVGLNGNPDQDYYEQLNKQFGGVGNCWSWCEEGAESYGGGSRIGPDIILYGLISPDKIDWEMTSHLSGTAMAELEIRTINGVPIEIYQIKTFDGKKLPLRKPIIVSSGHH